MIRRTEPVFLIPEDPCPSIMDGHGSGLTVAGVGPLHTVQGSTFVVGALGFLDLLGFIELLGSPGGFASNSLPFLI